MRSHAADRRPTVAVALALLAVVLAAGGADAVAQKARDLLGPGTVTGKHIRNGSVRPVDLHRKVLAAAGGQLEGPFSNLRLRDGAVGAREIIDGGVGTPELADGLVTSAKVADGALTGADVDEGTLVHRGRVAAIPAGGATDIDLDELGVVTLQCRGGADEARVVVGSPPADTTATNITIELATESGTPDVLGDRLAPGAAAVFLDTPSSTTANEGLSGKVTIGRTETTRHAVVELAGLTNAGGAETCWLDLQVTR